ncbi:MAG TPA: glycosyltransferase family 2 protein [Planctomycetaceae bacterium]|nr:glycosyltransferase family 2 protein [Planctomycetaceae bacterium]
MNTSARISVVITAHNEGDEVRRTLESVRENTRGLLEIILVDDGSTDGSCDRIDGHDVQLLRNPQRMGVAASRNAGAAVATAPILVFADAHQRFSPACLDLCAETATARHAIVWPDVCGLDDRCALCHGARFRFREGRGFYARWNVPRPAHPISRISSLKAPGYVMSRAIYNRVRWPAQLRGWGGSEAAVSLKAFFLGIPILHLCGPVVRHLFKESFQYQVNSTGVAWNHAVIARVCFEERTWQEHWLPHVFAKELPEATLNELNSPAVRDEHREFQRSKARSDRDFWRWLLKAPEPKCLRRAAVAVGAKSTQIATCDASN